MDRSILNVTSVLQHKVRPITKSFYEVPLWRVERTKTPPFSYHKTPQMTPFLTESPTPFLTKKKPQPRLGVFFGYVWGFFGKVGGGFLATNRGLFLVPAPPPRGGGNVTLA